MMFKGWVEYPGTMICVHQEINNYLTTNYSRSGGSKVTGSERKHGSLDDLELFLLSIPNPPKLFIREFISKLESET